MTHILIGAAAAAGLALLTGHIRRNRLKMRWWGWGFIAIGFVYLVFWLEIIASFLEEGAARGALVIGTILGFGVLLWAFLLARLMLARKGARAS